MMWNPLNGIEGLFLKFRDAPSALRSELRLITVTTTMVEVGVEWVPEAMLVEVVRVDPVVSLLSFIAGLALAGVPLVAVPVRRAGGAGEKWA
jgi:hypothetical protein